MYHILFIHELIKGHIDCFQVMVIMNKEAVNICLQVLFCDFDNIVTYSTIMNVIKRCRYRYLCIYIYIHIYGIYTYIYIPTYHFINTHIWNLLSPIFMPGFMSFKTFCAQSLNHVWFFVAQWTVAHQASLRELPFPTPGLRPFYSYSVTSVMFNFLWPHEL